MPVRQEFTLCTIHTTTHSEAELPQPSHNEGPPKMLKRYSHVRIQAKGAAVQSPAEETAKVCEGTSQTTRKQRDAACMLNSYKRAHARARAA